MGSGSAFARFPAIRPRVSSRTPGGAVNRELVDSSTEGRPGKPRRPFSFLEVIHGTGKLLLLLVGGEPEALTAKHSALNRASGVRVPAGPRDPGWANGRPLRSERSCPGSSPGPGTAPIGDRLMAGRQALALLVEVRVLVPERSRCATKTFFDNRIVDNARGRAPPRPQRCPCSRSGDGACLKRRRRWFESRRGHKAIANIQGGARVDERRFREPEAAGADPAIPT